MCDWVTAALAAAQAVVGSIGQMQQASSQAATARANADIMERNAQLARQQAAEEARRIREAGARVGGQQRTAFGAAGVAVEGTPLDVLGDTQQTVELDALTALYGGRVEASNLEYQAQVNRQQASYLRRSGVIGAGTSLLFGLGSAGVSAFGGPSKGGKPRPVPNTAAKPLSSILPGMQVGSIRYGSRG